MTGKAAARKGHWISVRTKTGRLIRVFLPNRGRPFDAGHGVKGVRRPMPSDLDERITERRRVFRREEGAGYAIEVAKNPLRRWIPEEKKYGIHLMEGGVSQHYVSVNKRESIDRAVTRMHRLMRAR
jgi:hypothetical protein